MSCLRGLLRPDERGSAAVEFAIILMPLMFLIMGMVDFGRAFNAQIEMTGAAREGARIMAIRGSNPSTVGTAVNDARLAAVAAAPSVALSTSNVTVTPSSCMGSTANVTVTINYNFPFVTGFYGANKALTGRAVMRCGG